MEVSDAPHNVMDYLVFDLTERFFLQKGFSPSSSILVLLLVTLFMTDNLGTSTSPGCLQEIFPNFQSLQPNGMAKQASNETESNDNPIYHS
jgi:hypothetical protein